MVAQLAKEDYNDLIAEGFAPTLEDFDRLNQLALRLEAGSETTPANYPRIGWAGDVPFYEPTAAAIMWLEDFAKRVPCDAETQNSFYYFALAHARKPEVFAELTDEKKIGAAVKDWLRMVGATDLEIARACHYAAWGFDDAVAPMSEMRREYLKRKNRTVAEDNMMRLERLITTATACTGMTYLDVISSTPSRLNDMVRAVQIEAGEKVSNNTAKAQVDYAMTLAEIRERLTKEKNNGN